MSVNSAIPNGTSRRVWTVGVLLALLGAGCFSERSESDTTGPSGTCRIPVGSGVVGSVQAVVAIREFRFFPDTLRVQRGTTVTWVNCEEDFANEPHTATDGGGSWGSVELPPAEIYSHRFDEAGVFRYFCEPHPFMSGILIVE
jgi:plastocyanin